MAPTPQPANNWKDYAALIEIEGDEAARNDRTLTLALSSRGNPDYHQNPARPMPGVPDTMISVSSLAEATQEARAWIEQHELGGGNWTGGQVFESDPQSPGQKPVQIAAVSFNGRIWATSQALELAAAFRQETSPEEDHDTSSKPKP